ncbi:NRAMP family divalent metal transporter [Clostridium sp. Mt-5]|uniref:NRAMP family divalent metal transporter n=1 Tax=Clostridium moutaii TaxID=3240932 RepID=A0ABV4BIY2_9CLOT
MSDNKNQNSLAKKVTDEKTKKSILWGATFFTATTSTVGAGFLTQTAQFAQDYKLSLILVIIMVFAINIFTQINVWRILCVSKLKAQDIANKIVPGLGYLISFLILLGAIAFNIGNIGGTALGFSILFGINFKAGYYLAGIAAIVIFLSKNIGRALDQFSKVIGIIMIFVIFYMTIVVLHGNATSTTLTLNYGTVFPKNPSTLLFPTITLMGGTIGGFILFSGMHRLIDAGIDGEENLKGVEGSAISTVAITTVIRIMLFLVTLGVVARGIKLDPSNPAASAFKYGAGNLGYMFFGVAILCAAVTSVVGASYTTISFFKTLNPFVNKHERILTSIIIAISTFIMTILGKPAKLLIVAGSLNGLIIPIMLIMILIASRRRDIVGDYKHPKWLFVVGIVIVVITSYAGIESLTNIKALFM